MGQRKWLRELFEGVALKDVVCGSLGVAREDTNTREKVDKNRERELGPIPASRQSATLCKTIECTKVGDQRLNNASGVTSNPPKVKNSIKRKGCHNVQNYLMHKVGRETEQCRDQQVDSNIQSVKHPKMQDEKNVPCHIVQNYLMHKTGT